MVRVPFAGQQWGAEGLGETLEDDVLHTGVLQPYGQVEGTRAGADDGSSDQLLVINVPQPGDVLTVSGRDSVQPAGFFDSSRRQWVPLMVQVA